MSSHPSFSPLPEPVTGCRAAVESRFLTEPDVSWRARDMARPADLLRRSQPDVSFASPVVSPPPGSRARSSLS